MALEMTTCRERLGKYLCHAMKGSQPITWPQGVSLADFDYSNPGIVVSAATWASMCIRVFLKLMVPGIVFKCE